MPSPRRNKLYPTPDDAESAFYDAFERADLSAMMAVWAEDDDVVCIHPQGPRLTGFAAVRDSWAQIFSGGTSRLRLQTVDGRKFAGQEVAVHSVIEVLSVPGREPTQSVSATNVYELTDNGWRMVAHHASPLSEPAAAAADDPTPPSHTLH